MWEAILLYKEGTYTRTIRWNIDTPLKVWIQPSDEEPYPTEQQRDLARDAVVEWMDIMSGVLDYAWASSEEDADLVVRWVTSFEANDNRIGQCDPGKLDSQGYFTKTFAEIKNTVLNPRTYRHEVGHCLGLHHSPMDEHVMSGRGTSNEIHDDEKHFMRLLYSLPPATKPIPPQ